MNKIIDEVAKLLMYKGPQIHEIIAEAVRENKNIDIENKENSTIIKSKFVTAYNTNVIDIYIFNSEKELIKQEIQINQKVKVVFDKYKDAKKILEGIHSQTLVAS